MSSLMVKIFLDYWLMSPHWPHSHHLVYTTNVRSLRPCENCRAEVRQIVVLKLGGTVSALPFDWRAQIVLRHLIPSKHRDSAKVERTRLRCRTVGFRQKWMAITVIILEVKNVENRGWQIDERRADLELQFWPNYIFFFNKVTVWILECNARSPREQNIVQQYPCKDF